ncbi:MAG: transglutaminase domain-containing protein [Clostridiaceae bacterium]|nr:transglutaminase domain-containing protein [Clostridiaceae bacterium]
MRLRRFLAFIFLIFIAISIKFPVAFQLLGIKVKAIPLVLPFNAFAADAEVGSAEEFQAVILEAIREVKDDIKVRIVKYDEKDYDINAVLKKVLAENVDLGFVSGCNASFTRTMGKDGAVVELKLQYLYPAEKIAAMRRLTDSNANDIIKNIIKPEMDEYERVLAVHDYVIKSSRYDRLNSDRDTVPPEEHEAYGVIVKGIGVCDSYAKAVKLLLEKAGVQCMLVEGSKVGDAGQGLNDVDHAWNIVRIDGEYYHVDATWNDVSEERDSIEMVYHHFNLNDEEMQKTHIWDRSKYPPCSGTKFNYFKYNKLIANNHEETLAMMVKAISNREKKLLVKIADYKSSIYNIEDLIKKAAVKCRIRQRLSAKWIVNDLLGIVDIEFTY